LEDGVCGDGGGAGGEDDRDEGREFHVCWKD
jgi:hypothetical protein